MAIAAIEQRTRAWREARAGKFTASRFADVLARNKRTGEPLKAYRDLIWDLIVERLSGQPIEAVSSQSLQWGIAVEPQAREAYELETGHIVRQVGFIQHATYPFAGASPDGLIGEDGGLEIKCPWSSAVHLERFLAGLPGEFRAQVQGGMWVTGRQWWDFVSFDPRLPEPYRLLCMRVARDEAYIQALEAAVLQAEEEAQKLLIAFVAKAA